MSLPSLNINSIRKIQFLKGLDKDGMIYKLSNDIEKLNQTIFTLTQKNREYKKLLLEYPLLKQKLKENEEELKLKNSEKISLIKEKDEQNSELFNKITNLENTMQIEKLNYDKNTILYQQKMSVFNHIRN